jgi:hypothetical protein
MTFADLVRYTRMGVPMQWHVKTIKNKIPSFGIITFSLLDMFRVSSLLSSNWVSLKYSRRQGGHEPYEDFVYVPSV